MTSSFSLFTECLFADEEQSKLFAQKGDAVATLLLTCHQHLHKAKHPRHAIEALGPLKALVLLLGDHVKVASTFRYLINILLQQLDIRSAFNALVHCTAAEADACV